MSKTYSITTPEKLEEELRHEAEKIGISRSRFICNILLDWQKNRNAPTNDCLRNREGYCTHYEIGCKAPQSEAETCEGYRKE